MKLKKVEQETIILFNEKEKTNISVTTCNKKLQNKLEQVGHFSPVYTAVFDNCCSKEYIIPLNWLQLRKPPSRQGKLTVKGKENDDV